MDCRQRHVWTKIQLATSRSIRVRCKSKFGRFCVISPAGGGGRKMEAGLLLTSASNTGPARTGSWECGRREVAVAGGRHIERHWGSSYAVAGEAGIAQRPLTHGRTLACAGWARGLQAESLHARDAERWSLRQTARVAVIGAGYGRPTSDSRFPPRAAVATKCRHHTHRETSPPPVQYSGL